MSNFGIFFTKFGIKLSPPGKSSEIQSQTLVTTHFQPDLSRSHYYPLCFFITLLFLWHVLMGFSLCSRFVICPTMKMLESQIKNLRRKLRSHHCSNSSFSLHIFHRSQAGAADSKVAV